VFIRAASAVAEPLAAKNQAKFARTKFCLNKEQESKI